MGGTKSTALPRPSSAAPNSGLLVAGRPEFAAALAGLLGLLLRGPDFLGGLGFLLGLFGLLERDRFGGLGDEVDRFAGADVLGDHLVATVLAQALEQLLGGCSFVFGAVGERLDQLLVGDLDPLGGGDRGDDRLALQL